MHRHASPGILSSALFAASLLVGPSGVEAQCAGEVSAQARSAPTYCTLSVHGNAYAVRVENVQRVLGGGYRSTRVTRVATVPGQGSGFDCDYQGFTASLELHTQSGMEPFDLPLPAACNQPIEIASSMQEPILWSNCQVEVACVDALVSH